MTTAEIVTIITAVTSAAVAIISALRARYHARKAAQNVKG